ncbi:hypothetical protein HK101_011731 [Irineochytrium annulatum]|nr:hypothetical protein HK101_011731 [Irineochytrium annulatum]
MEGSLGGMAQVAVGHPLDTVKVRLQLDGSSRFKGPFDCVMQTVRNEGVLGLYKGMASPLIGMGFINAILFSAYGWFKEVLRDPKQADRPLAIRQLAAAGALAGVVNSFVAAPIELVKIRLQAQYSLDPLEMGRQHVYKGPLDVGRGLIREHGVVRGLFHGTWSTVVREIPVSVPEEVMFAYAGFYGGFEYAKRVLTPASPDPNTPVPVSRLMIAGAFGGIMYWTCCYPLDVAKSRIQQAAPGTRTTQLQVSVIINSVLIYKTV